MKQAILIIGSIFLLANIAFGLVLKSFDTFNIFFSSGAIIITTIILLIVDYIKMKDAFKVPLFFVTALCGLIEYIIGLVVKPERNEMIISGGNYYENSGCQRR